MASNYQQGGNNQQGGNYQITYNVDMVFCIDGLRECLEKVTAKSYQKE